MRKLLYLLLLCSFLGLTGCDSKEEAMATVVEAPCKEAGVNFTLNGLWVVKSEEEANMDILAGQKVVLSAYQQETGAGIDIICEDLTQTEGGTLVRMDDYLADIQEQLKISEEFSYSCSEVSAENVYGEEYQGREFRTDTWICIDAGAAMGESPMLLRLDDKKAFYGKKESV